MIIYSIGIYPSGRRVLSQLCMAVSTPTHVGLPLSNFHQCSFVPHSFSSCCVFSFSTSVFLCGCFLCVAFCAASAFNADLSKWQTGAVTQMGESEYTNHVWLPLSNVHQCSLCHSFFLFLLCVLFLHLCFSCGCFLV